MNIGLVFSFHYVSITSIFSSSHTVKMKSFRRMHACMHASNNVCILTWFFFYINGNHTETSNMTIFIYINLHLPVHISNSCSSICHFVAAIINVFVFLLNHFIVYTNCSTESVAASIIACNFVSV